MLVLDSSAAVAALVGDPPNAPLVERLEAQAELHAPHLIDLEFASALRRLVHRGELDLRRAEAAREDYRDLPIVRYPHLGLLDRVWALRENVSAYDAAFIALSEALGAPLVTVDARLAASRGHGAIVESF